MTSITLTHNNGIQTSITLMTSIEINGNNKISKGISDINANNGINDNNYDENKVIHEN